MHIENENVSARTEPEWSIFLTDCQVLALDQGFSWIIRKEEPAGSLTQDRGCPDPEEKALTRCWRAELRKPGESQPQNAPFTAGMVLGSYGKNQNQKTGPWALGRLRQLRQSFQSRYDRAAELQHETEPRPARRSTYPIRMPYIDFCSLKEGHIKNQKTARKFILHKRVCQILKECT